MNRKAILNSEIDNRIIIYSLICCNFKELVLHSSYNIYFKATHYVEVVIPFSKEIRRKFIGL